MIAVWIIGAVAYLWLLILILAFVTGGKLGDTSPDVDAPELQPVSEALRAAQEAEIRAWHRAAGWTAER